MRYFMVCVCTYSEAGHFLGRDTIGGVVAAYGVPRTQIDEAVANIYPRRVRQIFELLEVNSNEHVDWVRKAWLQRQRENQEFRAFLEGVILPGRPIPEEKI